MKYKIVLSHDAERDLDEAFLWYESQLPLLGEKFIQFVNDGFEFIASNPNSSPFVFDNFIKRNIIRTFPFGIYYLVNEPMCQVAVIAILHFKRDENIWKNRAIE